VRSGNLCLARAIRPNLRSNFGRRVPPIAAGRPLPGQDTLPINTYRLVGLGSGRWGIEWLLDEQSQGLVWGSYADILDALECAYELVQMEMQGASRRFA
jgi:hypothetical protein